MRSRCTAGGMSRTADETGGRRQRGSACSVPRRRQSTLEARARRVPRTAAKIGWRFWGITAKDGAYRLSSPFRSSVWPTDEPLVAECLGTTKALGVSRRAHDAPSAPCRCGIYGGTYRALRTFLSGTFVPPAEAGVLGRVFLWGTV